MKAKPRRFQPLRFEQVGSEDFVEITLADGDVSEPGADLLVFVSVQTTGFTAHLDTWIIRPAWEDFCDELSRLEKTRQGAASIASISPGELELLVQSTDRAGHMAVGGLVGTVIGCSKVSMTFSPVRFCPTTLPKLARTARAWLTR